MSRQPPVSCKFFFVRCHVLRPYLQLVYNRYSSTRKNRLLVPEAGTYFSRYLGAQFFKALK